MAVFSASIFSISASNAACEEVLLEVVTSAIIEFTSLTAIDAAELALDDVALLVETDEAELAAELALDDVALLLETDEAELAAELALDDVALLVELVEVEVEPVVATTVPLYLNARLSQAVRLYSLMISSNSSV
ncbi:hypothetical protein ATW62_11030 [Oenococcus oeni]|nr:hypothetical protein ATW62_11030 [Oenococcus oeni]